MTFHDKIRAARINARFTPQESMDLIRHLAAYGTESIELQIEVRRYSDDNCAMMISVNNSIGVHLTVHNATVTLPGVNETPVWIPHEVMS